MIEREKQLNFEGYRLRRIDSMLTELNIKHAKEYRRKMLPLFKDNTRVNGAPEERLFDFLKLKLELKQKT